MFSPQAPAVHRLFCSPSAVVEEYFLSTAFGFLFAAQEAIWLSFGSTDDDIRLFGSGRLPILTSENSLHRGSMTEHHIITNDTVHDK